MEQDTINNVAVCCFDKQGLSNLDRPFWRGFITRQPFQPKAQLACACVRNCVYDNGRNGNPDRNNVLCLSPLTSHFGSPMFCNNGTWATTRVGMMGSHIKPNNFSIIYIRRMKNSADQKKPACLRIYY